MKQSTKPELTPWNH